MKKKILIVGGTGFIGKNFVLKCLENNLEVTILSSIKRKNKYKKINQICCDITDKKSLYKKLSNKKFDYVVNLAGYIDHSKKVKTIKTHYNGCKNLANFFKKNKILKFIQIGSSVEYGKLRAPQIEYRNTNENTLKSNYGLAKLKSTKYLLHLNKKYSFPSTILRLFIVYGPGQKENRLVPFVINNCIKGKRFNLSSGKQIRDFLYVDDATTAIFKCLTNKKSNGHIINISSGLPIKIKSLVNKIYKLIKNGKPIFGKIKLRPEEPIKLYSNFNKAKKLLKWSPKIGLNKGLKKTINHYKSDHKDSNNC